MPPKLIASAAFHCGRACQKFSADIHDCRRETVPVSRENRQSRKSSVTVAPASQFSSLLRIRAKDEDKLHADDSGSGRPSRMAQLNSLNHPILQVPSFGGAMVSMSTLGSGTVPSAS